MNHTLHTITAETNIGGMQYPFLTDLPDGGWSITSWPLAAADPWRSGQAPEPTLRFHTTWTCAVLSNGSSGVGGSMFSVPPWK